MTAVLSRAAEAIDRTDPFDLVARLSLVLLLMNAHQNRWLLVLAAAACAVMFLDERLLRSPWPWLAIAAVLGTSQLSEWWVVDNHRFAATAWLTAIGLSRFAHDPKRVLSLSARLIVVVIFTFAFGWKLLSTQYMSGDFFRYILLRDHRFEPVAALVVGADEDQLGNDRAAVADFTSNGRLDQTIEITEAPGTETVAWAFTSWGLVLEGAIALVFAVPLRGRSRLLRHGALLLFCATTYAVAPIIAFGLLLMSLGLAQAESSTLRRTYVIGSALVFVWGVIVIQLA